MLVCETWLAGDFLLTTGFTITAPTTGGTRTATRGAYTVLIEPACTCPDCPPRAHPRYRHTSSGVAVTVDPASREGRLAALDRLIAATAGNLRADDPTWCAHEYVVEYLRPLLEGADVLDEQVLGRIYAGLPACRTARCSRATQLAAVYARRGVSGGTSTATGDAA